MQWTSTTDRYGGIAIALHWITAIAIIGLLASGLQAAGTVDPAAKKMLLTIHATLGLLTLLLTLLRIVWWWFIDRRPGEPAGVPVWQARLARTVHLFFYAAILALSTSGIVMLILSGAGAILFLGAAGPLPDFWAYAARGPHGIGARILLAMVVAHVGAALYHQFFRRDHLLARMGVGR